MPDAVDPADGLARTLQAYAQKARKDLRLRVPPADSVTIQSPLCGSQLTLDARIEDGRVRGELGHRIRACSLGQAATMIVAAHADGLDLPTVRKVHGQLQAILDGSGEHSDWPELEIFAQVRDVPNRHGAVLLPFRALELLFERAAGHAGGSAGRGAGSITMAKE